MSAALQRSPRCPRCGRAPPIRRVTMGDSQVRITTTCRRCNTKYEIATDELALDSDVEQEAVAG